MLMADLIPTGETKFFGTIKKDKILSKDFSKIKPQSYKLEMEKLIETILNNKQPFTICKRRFRSHENDRFHLFIR